MKHNIIHIRGVPEKRRDQRIKKLFEDIMTKHVPNLVKEKDTQVQEAQIVPNKMDPKRSTLRHIIMKMAKAKEKRIF